MHSADGSDSGGDSDGMDDGGGGILSSIIFINPALKKHWLRSHKPVAIGCAPQILLNSFSKSIFLLLQYGRLVREYGVFVISKHNTAYNTIHSTNTMHITNTTHNI